MSTGISLLPDPTPSPIDICTRVGPKDGLLVYKPIAFFTVTSYSTGPIPFLLSPTKPGRPMVSSLASHLKGGSLACKVVLTTSLIEAIDEYVVLVLKSPNQDYVGDFLVPLFC